MINKIQIHENPAGIDANAIIGIAKRENNEKRPWLMVNKKQAKHVPARPYDAMGLFDMLGQSIYPHIDRDSETVYIGFAETATAIGAHIAGRSPGKSAYLHTTRENIDRQYKIVDFQEEHSHATQQKLYCSDATAMLFKADNIIFIEDEITTGKTILNFIEALEKAGIKSKFAAASIFNSMHREHRAAYEQRGIRLYYLARLENAFEGWQFNGCVVPEQDPGVNHSSMDKKEQCREIPGRPEPRLGVPATAYEERCRELAAEILANANAMNGSVRNVLVLGTEECMYPALVLARFIEDSYRDGEHPVNAYVHATTRSPILPMADPAYPLNNRQCLESVYEKNRKTFIYNLDRYDKVFIITDALDYNEKGMAALTEALRAFGNREIEIIRWV